ncbi:8083_t:CDS:2 [Funneliformis geosporum]|uniref:18118_t:CDS:1 n=1 Tax=Funneliformis geosporum TaxID=1117311 RepID=A0A9W4T5S5_9GLOM|nr:18118_t:CDS:2 [Funneliformis geosporum]CAI2194168.1 8083_t:CDS:2 [Funneliformis geosporum]
MSNYSSLSRVLSPFRVQTKFEENSLPARSNVVSIRYTMAYYFVLGEVPVKRTLDFVEFDSSELVMKLRHAIYDKKKNTFSKHNVDESNLILWKVDIPFDKDNVKLQMLDDTTRTINVEQELEGKEMFSRDPISVHLEHFDETRHSIHVIVQPSPPPATTGKRIWDLDDGNEDRHRKKVKPSVPEAILARAKKIMEDIKKLPENPEDYSNPKKFLSLPFPFLGERKPVERFSINDDDQFMYMGRKAFVKVLNTIDELKRGCGFMDCFIYGTMGYGKSYILATIACFLFRTGKRVVYLPDCRELARDTKDYVKSALYLAYENNSDKINKIYTCETLDEIVKFCKEESELLYIVVDQMNALDSHNNTEIDETIKRQTIAFLNQITTKHYYIKSSSANNTSALRLALKQANEKKIELYGGFDEDEILQWWIKNISNLPSMDDEQKKQIEYITGRNPLFLSFILDSKKDFDDTLDCLNQLLADKIQEPMTNFSEIISRDERWDLHVKLMSLCLTSGYTPFGYGTDDYDHRFFYIDNNKCCHCSSGFVRDCMADYLFEKGRLEVFTNPSWIQCIKEFKNNPSVMGFMVEKACLSSIVKNGFIANVINFKPDNYKFFTSIQEINFSMNEGPCTFYLPRRWNQKSIDGLITLHKLQNKKEKVDKDTLYIVPIQITFDKETHSDSEASFFSGIWPGLKSKMLGDLKVEVIFIWITRENDVDYFVEANEKMLKGRMIEINPQYTSIVTTFKSINVELENILSY